MIPDAPSHAGTPTSHCVSTSLTSERPTPSPNPMIQQGCNRKPHPKLPLVSAIRTTSSVHPSTGTRGGRAGMSIIAATTGENATKARKPSSKKRG